MGSSGGGAPTVVEITLTNVASYIQEAVAVRVKFVEMYGTPPNYEGLTAIVAPTSNVVTIDELAALIAALPDDPSSEFYSAWTAVANGPIITFTSTSNGYWYFGGSISLELADGTGGETVGYGMHSIPGSDGGTAQAAVWNLETSPYAALIAAGQVVRINSTEFTWGTGSLTNTTNLRDQLQQLSDLIATEITDVETRMSNPGLSSTFIIIEEKAGKEGAVSLTIDIKP